ncbi:hypothetical protein HBI24_207770 [Parastagonospora nodorum]|nr:hypothetical protein HBH49_207270 [Parastagonospora nodorum]KAH4112764.1 hypothetical protein HBH47_221220 [Parastagonospora nodorum]KAH4799907.1 hypothetical protein HBH61_220810 [Parastagonospora nodorum]KAH5293965.1 hypothetical protein HBI12_226300 [Parastagonospora nodorum]KAH5340886.1 hypothetical protein HBI48_238350 [Parastagonospora nodorum]
MCFDEFIVSNLEKGYLHQRLKVHPSCWVPGLYSEAISDLDHNLPQLPTSHSLPIAPSASQTATRHKCLERREQVPILAARTVDGNADRTCTSASADVADGKRVGMASQPESDGWLRDAAGDLRYRLSG